MLDVGERMRDTRRAARRLRPRLVRRRRPARLRAPAVHRGRRPRAPRARARPPPGSPSRSRCRACSATCRTSRTITFVEGFSRATGIATTRLHLVGRGTITPGAFRGPFGSYALASSTAGGRSGRAIACCSWGHRHGGQLFAIVESQLRGAPRVAPRGAPRRGARSRGGRGCARGAPRSSCAAADRPSRPSAPPAVQLGGRRALPSPPRHSRAHRGAEPRAALVAPRQILLTRHTATTSHHLSGHGSDFPAPTAAERAWNARLGSRARRGIGRAHVAPARERAGCASRRTGCTVLVDYGGDTRVVPNSSPRGSGHAAAYTRRDSMLFHARLFGKPLLSVVLRSGRARAAPASPAASVAVDRAGHPPSRPGAPTPPKAPVIPSKPERRERRLRGAPRTLSTYSITMASVACPLVRSIGACRIGGATHQRSDKRLSLREPRTPTVCRPCAIWRPPGPS